MTRPTLNDAEWLVTVVAVGGFRAAAQRLGVPASSVSDAIRRLEKALGVSLLNRTTRSVTPTEAGLRLLSRIKPALSEIDIAFDRIAEDATTPAGTLRLNAPFIVAEQILPDLASRFLVAHPLIRLEVKAEDKYIDVFASGFDAGIRYERIDRDMVAIPIGPRRQRFVLAAAPAYIAAHGAPQHATELAQHAMIGHRFAASGIVNIWNLERGDEAFRIMPEGRLISSSIKMSVAAAVAGLGICLTFEEEVSAHFAEGNLVPILRDWWPSFAGPCLYYHKQRYMAAPLRAFVDFVKTDHLRKH